MQTLIFLLLSFLFVVFSILLYFKLKNQRISKLNSGECPDCKEKTRTFYDENTRTMFKNEVITKRVLKNHGCSGVVDIEYKCKNCNLKEVHQVPSNSCNM
ncbi:hypothetical protein [Arcobacter sp. CECT 8985]|uniref:hypothetical protein n=1 Tax=Arcobacter sp. CECT 8985 TaxID=1935424 RepID=UPI00100A6F5C|nr:hypothetical protein [Arcobacter sp. CECT 8985]RXJ85571.1 hypothetical protein CRU93_11150 [Arcobacter sp. CECT 8985]